MSLTSINGGVAIRPGTITADRFVTGLGLATSQLADGAKFVKSDGTVAMTASLSLGGNTIQNSGTPVNANDLVPKNYVDALVSGFRLHGAQVVSTANQSALTGLPTVDGVTMTAGSVVLLVAQTTASQNGPWVVASGSWTRPTWWASASVQPEGNYFLIDPDGTTYKNTKWFITTTGSITVDTTNVTFTQDQSGTAYTAGNGLTLAGTQFSVNPGNGISVSGGSVTAVGTGLVSVTASGIQLASTTAANIIVANSAGVPTYVALSGDATLSNAGVLSLNSTISRVAKYISNEVPGGTINGTNTAFTLANTPVTGTLMLVYDGMVLKPGASYDYTISGSAITLNFAPSAADNGGLLAFYISQ